LQTETDDLPSLGTVAVEAPQTNPLAVPVIGTLRVVLRAKVHH
jgi:hypothetical protein